MTRREMFSLAAVPVLGASGSGVTAQVKQHNGTPTFFLNGEPLSYLCNWITAPAPESWARAAEAGIHIYAMDVGGGHEWVKPDYDFSGVKARYGRILDADPKALFHLRCQLEIGADDWWSKLHPEELELHSNGRRYTQSFASTVWREQAKTFLGAYVRALQEQGLYDRVVAIQVGAGHTGEWVKGETSMYDVCGDYSEPMRRHFRSWLRKRYADDVARLRKAWNNAAVSFDTAEVPPAADQLNAKCYLLRDPKLEGRTIDYFRCLAELCGGLVVDFCQTVKRVTGGSKLAGAFYGYLMELAWNGGFFAERPDSAYSTYQRSGHIGLRQVLESPDVDFLVSPYSYGFRGIGGDGPSMVPSESARLHGKLVLIEDDTRTHLGTERNYGHANTLAESTAILRRNFAGAMTRGQGVWWLTGTVDAAREPAFRPLLKQFDELGRRLIACDYTPASDVAVLLDDESLLYESSLLNFDVPGIFEQKLWGLAHMGTPFDTYLLEDLVQGRLRPYKLYVFLNAFRLDRARRAALARALRRNGAVALWIYAAGYAADELSLANMADLTGIQCVMSDKPWSARMHLTNFTHPITRGLSQDLGWGTHNKLGPIFSVEDPAATVLGQVVFSEGSCRAGMAVRQFADWTSIYSSAPALPAPLLRNIARFAGAHIYSDDGDVLYASRELLGVHTIAGGRRRFTLPRAAGEVIDLFANRVVARGASHFEVELAPASTAFYRFSTRT